ncbi:MAG: fibro-slime domain-containing protein [Byssovorax sp.]
MIHAAPRPTRRLSLAVALLALLAGCGARSSLRVPPVPEDAGTGGAGGEGGQGGEGGMPPCTGPLPVQTAIPITIRDFLDTHPDFEKFIDDDPGIIESTLGPDQKPVYGPHESTATTTGKSNFDQWYRDVPGVNLRKDTSIPFLPIIGGQAFADDTFFPIDDELFGNQGREHNFHFTVEGHTTFRYQGGEIFALEGDDDLWVFLDRQLVIDLGGVHGAESGEVHVDDWATLLGLSIGGVYPLDFFFAERHTSGSDLRIQLLGFTLCP